MAATIGDASGWRRLLFSELPLRLILGNLDSPALILRLVVLVIAEEILSAVMYAYASLG